jgi:trehalose-6-phosphate synthase
VLGPHVALLNRGGGGGPPEIQGHQTRDEDKGRLIMISNRLPLSRVVDERTGAVSYRMSSGGLVTALSGVRDELNFLWIGWIGCEIPPEDQVGLSLPPS